MDIFDQATIQEELAREVALKAVRGKPPVLSPTGACFNCSALLMNHHAAPACFCDADCRDDWQRRNNGA